MAVDVPHLSDRDSLWSLIISPSVWAAHFLFVYVFAAIICEKAPAGGAILLGLDAVRLGVLAATLVALAAIVWAGLVAWTRWRDQASQAQSRIFAAHDSDTVESRRRFMAFSAVLLSGLSFVAVVFQALPAVFIATCA
jgi:hypothetical protein